MAKSKTPTTANAEDDVEQQEFSFIAGGNATGTATLGNSLAAYFKN